MFDEQREVREGGESSPASATVYRGDYDDALALQVEFGALGIDVELVLEDDDAEAAELRVPEAMHDQVRPLVDKLTATLLEEERGPLVDPNVAEVDAIGRRICFLFATGVGLPFALLLAPVYFAAAKQAPPSPRVHTYTMFCLTVSALVVASVIVAVALQLGR